MTVAAKTPRDDAPNPLRADSLPGEMPSARATCVVTEDLPPHPPNVERKEITSAIAARGAPTFSNQDRPHVGGQQSDQESGNDGRGGQSAVSPKGWARDFALSQALPQCKRRIVAFAAGGTLPRE